MKWLYTLQTGNLTNVYELHRIQVCHVLYDNTGVPGELYYCRNGVVNDYALSFNLPIKTDITEIYFSWVNAPPLGLQKPDITVSL